MRLRSWPLLVLASIAVAPPRAMDGQGRTPRQEIAALEDAWIRAVIARDAAAFKRLLHRDFVYTENDRVYTRDQLIAEVTTTADTTTAGRNENLVVRVHGPVAIATGWLVLSGRSGGRPFERRYRYTDTWLKVGSGAAGAGGAGGAGGRWRVLAAHDYLVP